MAHCRTSATTFVQWSGGGDSPIRLLYNRSAFGLLVGRSWHDERLHAVGAAVLVSGLGGPGRRDCPAATSADALQSALARRSRGDAGTALHPRPRSLQPDAI